MRTTSERGSTHMEDEPTLEPQARPAPLSDSELKHANLVEANIAAFIEQREAEAHRAGSNTANARAKEWRESEARYRETLQQANGAQWVEHFRRAAELHERLAREARAKAEQLRRGRYA